ncbi:hypothetical protein LRP49_05830 [Enterovibrio sp. ZSDZ35]|uniref:Uncharacterized protein n=1 Tax=Enterovibrio qingdaonensis TaxID=2899818 RepID=A0ABT5QJS1_9GAMM|nr:hypothetical protein [Enterovibrio sp. ZSDZ35]MDD1780720.1 hypothetical protein [Enterovibrio sp. ZSDZ35]
MAAEKLTTARLVQILVVLSILIGAFVWRTIEYSPQTNKLACELVAQTCSVSVNGETVIIVVNKQGDSLSGLEITANRKPTSLTLTNAGKKIELSDITSDENSANSHYIYAVNNSNDSPLSANLILIIDQDQIEINF